MTIFRVLTDTKRDKIALLRQQGAVEKEIRGRAETIFTTSVCMREEMYCSGGDEKRSLRADRRRGVRGEIKQR